MKFDDLDKKMRVYETNKDYSVPPEVYMVARIDGRGFTKLTKEKVEFAVPFDETFRNYMVDTTKHLMNCGFRIIYGFTESDEISLLFHLNDSSFGRKTRKLNSILAGEASAKFSLLIGQIGAFDCRISELPNMDLVTDYFRWRNEDASRNALNSHCYWLLRKKGVGANEATHFLSKKTVSFKNEFLFKNGVNFNHLPEWQRRGIGLYWEEYDKTGFDIKNNIEVLSKRKRIKINLELPMKDDYSNFVRDLILASE